MIVLQSITVLSVLCAVSSHAKRQYHFIYDRMNMTDAVKYCREKYTDLATIDNMDDVKILNDTVDLSKMVISKGSYAAWIGLYDDVNSWRWSLADRHFYKDGETEFRKWSDGEPNNAFPGESCTEMLGENWNDEPCDRRSVAVCVDARGPNGTFVLTPNSMTWTDARTYCREHHTDLASVRNEADNLKIKNLTHATPRVWIGLFRDSWKWSDGSDSSFRNWKEEEPYNSYMTKEACVVADLGQSSKWEDWSCDDIAAFICYSRVMPVTKQVIKVRLVKKDSSLDLDDPAVMEDLLKQFKQRLNDKGVTGDIKLSWKKQSDGKVFRKEKKKDEL